MAINWHYPKAGNSRTAWMKRLPRMRGNAEHGNICMTMMSLYQRSLYDEADVEELIRRLKIHEAALGYGWFNKSCNESNWRKRLRKHMGFGTNIDHYTMPQFLRHVAKCVARDEKEAAARRKREKENGQDEES